MEDPRVDHVIADFNDQSIFDGWPEILLPSNRNSTFLCVASYYIRLQIIQNEQT